MARDPRYWERFDANFFRERAYRRMIGRYSLGYFAVAIAVAVWGGFLVVDGNGRGWLLLLGSFCLLMGVSLMWKWLFKAKQWVKHD